MPIANCFIKNKMNFSNIDSLLKTLSDKLTLSISDITINFIRSSEQVGRSYDLMIFLYLPTLWKQEDVERVELTFVNTFSDHFKLSSNNIFLITTMVQSGHVVDNNKIQRW